jgi:hypothetical protein
MAYSSHIKASGVKARSGGRGSSKSSTSVNTYGRVIHVVLSLDDPYCLNPSMINGVYFRTPKVAANESDISKFPFAYQGSAQNRTIPLAGEIVTLYTGVDTNSLANPGATKFYWKEIVNLWNHPHHNAAPDTLQSDWEENLLKGFPTQKNINPLIANPGDTLIEGRLGQSIRFGGSKGASTLIDISNDGKPIIVLSNGQVETDNGSDLIEENINEDFNSIYLLSDHKVPLTAANSKRAAYDVAPIAADQYIGNQILVNGGRLFFNAKEESILLSAKESIGLNASTLNFDAQEYACIDAKRIYLGSKARASAMREPAVLGTQLENWLTTLLETLESLAVSLSSATSVTGGPVTQLNAAGPELGAAVKSLKTQIILFQSKKVFTE